MGDQVPNDGLIRYFSILNDERIHVTNTQGLVQLLQKDPYLYRKAMAQGQLVRFLASDDVVVDKAKPTRSASLSLSRGVILTVSDCP
jgi:hypothetical protein